MPPAALRFRDDGRFSIVQFTDLHWRNGDQLDRRTRRAMERILAAERPDLAVLTGDVIDGSECRDPARSWRQAVAPLEQQGVRWAAVLGNHDDEGSVPRAELLEIDRAHPLSLSDPGPDARTGVGNFLLEPRAAHAGTTAAVLYFLDSGGYAPDPPGGYAWIAPDQIDWYRTKSRRIAEAYRSSGRAGASCPGVPPALAFFHIPLPEFRDVWERGGCRGSQREPVCCPLVNSGFFRAVCETGDVVGVFVGHDHLNDYAGTLEAVWLCYGRATGHGGYGRDDLPRGARVIELREGIRDFTTWLRLEDGSVDPQPRSPA